MATNKRYGNKLTLFIRCSYYMRWTYSNNTYICRENFIDSFKMYSRINLFYIHAIFHDFNQLLEFNYLHNRSYLWKMRNFVGKIYLTQSWSANSISDWFSFHYNIMVVGFIDCQWMATMFDEKTLILIAIWSKLPILIKFALRFDSNLLTITFLRDLKQKP